MAASLLAIEPPPPEAPGAEPPPTSVTFLAEDTTTDTGALIAADLVRCVEHAIFTRPRVECVILEGCGVSLRYLEPDRVPLGECVIRARRRLEALP